MYQDAYWLARWAFERALAVVYLIAFIAAIQQFTPLLGERGLLPVPRFIKRVPFRESPSIFYLHYSDTFLKVIAGIGAFLSVCVLAGWVQRGPLWLGAVVWFVLWAFYLSIVNVGQTFYGFGWESIMLEAGFLAIFLGPASLSAPFIVILLIRWLLFRVEFGAGLIKMRGDPCWRDLTCLDYHYETQPLPNPLSWYAHHLPPRFHKISVAGNHFTQLIVPWALFAPQPIASIAALLMILTQGWLVLTGNYAWLNYITIILAFSGFSDGVLRSILPLGVPATAPLPPAFYAVLLALAAATVILSIPPVANMFSPGQLMNFSYNPLHLVGTYGAFGSVTKRRLEVIVEGTRGSTAPGDDLTRSTGWREYEFKAKPGDPRRMPPIVAPYHLRIDWLMWFLPFSPYQYPAWFPRFCAGLLSNDPQVLSLIRTNPFPDAPPRYVRARFYLYHFSTPAERQETGQWWTRSVVAEYLPPLSLDELIG
jgi:hypothetical protein